MRITNNMMISNMMLNLNRTMLSLDKRQMQAYTGKRVHKPSDDPIAVSRSLKVRADISQLYQYDRNVDDAISWLETTELAVDNANEAVHRFRELMVQGANGPLTVEETTKIQEEIKEIKAQLISLGNSSYGSSYIFSGKKTNQALFDSQGNYQIDLRAHIDPAFVDDRHDIQVGNYENIGVNTLGLELFEAIEKPLVYSNEIEGLPLEDGGDLTISLPMVEGEEAIEVILKIDTNEEESIDINQDGTGARISLNSTDNEEQLTAIIGTLREMGEVYGSPLKGYDFDTSETKELDNGDIKDVLTIRATPKDAMGIDRRTAQALWETGEISPPDENGNYSLSFMGINLNIVQKNMDNTTGANIDIEEITKHGASIVIDGQASSKEYAETISNVFETISQIDGAKIAAFEFKAMDFDGGNDENGWGLQVLAPKDTGNLYNKEEFTGTLEIANEGIGNQLIIPGQAEKRVVSKGQKAGLIQLIDKLEGYLLEGNTDEIGKHIGEIDQYHQNLLKIKSEVGAKVNRSDLIKERIADNTINFRDLQSQLEDADMGEVLMELINEENVYRSALAVGARIIQPTLLDFLR